MSKGALDRFGLLFMQRVRDAAIREVDADIKGKAKDMIGKRVRDILKNTDAKTQEALLQVVPIVVDTVLHNVLWMFEDEPELKISIETPSENVPDLTKISDGFSGELYTSVGWIARFSKERYDKSIA
jgi:hypothetical protein